MRRQSVWVRGGAVLLALALSAALLTGCSDVQRPDASSAQAVSQAAGSAPEREPEASSAEPVPEQSAPEAEPSQEEDFSRQAEQILSSMTREERIYQLFIVTHEQLTGVGQVTRSGETTRKAIEKKPVGGVIYFGPNIVTPDQVRDMIQGIQDSSRLGLFVAVDEEGGRVARLGNNSAMGTTAFPGGLAALGRTKDPERVHQAGLTIGRDISRFGFNLDLAPVAEITDDTEHSVIGDRSFGGDEALVAQMVAEMVQGLHEGGVLCTLKHFPGHGDTTTDPHDGYTEMTKGLEELRSRDFVPFRAGVEAGADFLMMGHFSSPQLTGDDTPATLSGPMIALAREELGFRGIVMTDSLSMGAITDRYSSAEAAVAALEAGADVILMPADLDSAVQGIEDALEDGRLTQERIDESVGKILTKKLEAGIIPAAQT